jgi:hypothetical protein
MMNIKKAQAVLLFSLSAISLIAATPLFLSQSAQAQQNHRVKIWFEITGSDDGVGDNTLEIYGQVRINGNVLCNFDRGSAKSRQREAGQTLDCGTTRINGSNMTINGNLVDYDSGSADDKIFNMSPRVVQLVSGNTRTFSQRQSGGEGATMYIRID